MTNRASPDPLFDPGLNLDLDSIFLDTFHLDSFEGSSALDLARDDSVEDATWGEFWSRTGSSPPGIPPHGVREPQHPGQSSILANCPFADEKTPKLYDLLGSTNDTTLFTKHNQTESQITDAAVLGTTTRQLCSHTENSLSGSRNSTAPKLGGRFSRESVRILKHWLSSNSSNPYPSEREKKWLQDQTGLNKTQISNWLANARRRGKVQAPISLSPLVGNASSKPRNIPRRPGTPAPRNDSAHLNPLERWVDSPPEHEPATVTAIARAMAFSSQNSEHLISSPYPSSVYDGSTNSLDTSRSSGSSLASTSSDASRVSWSSFRPFGRTRSRRRKVSRRTTENRSLLAPLKTYQCTFCTETFKTKHDWQRHENSLHLPLDRWICAPDGPCFQDPRSEQLCCVYCGQQDPDDAHIKTHNHSTCQGRSLQERTFNRKDHLNQHLRLVHNVKYSEWLMRSWKAAMPAIQSRCGFCGAALESWDSRANHLADHFKSGKSMADWKGDWGFEPPVLQLIENAIPPYMVDSERYTPFPFEASKAPAESPRNAYELIKLELAYFMQNYFDKMSRMPDVEEMRLEACRIILASETEFSQDCAYPSSWLRDLIMADESICQRAKFSPLRLPMESRLFALRINGKNNMFEGCVFESQLNDFVTTKQLEGLEVSTNDIQQEACCIISRIEEISATPSDFIANWLVKLATKSLTWLKDFCQRADIVPCDTDDPGTESEIPPDPREPQLGVKGLSDGEVQQEAQLMVYQFGGGRQTVAGDNVWLLGFKPRNSCQSHLHVPTDRQGPTLATEPSLSLNPAAQPMTNAHPPKMFERDVDPHTFMLKTGTFFLNDANFYRWLGEELGRWVAATMSPNNPTCHVPSDEEIQHYARWISYHDDDPWNQTAADNPEWLEWFKCENGIM